MATNPYRIVIIENKSTPTISFKLKKMESDTEAKIAAVNSIIELSWSSSFLFIIYFWQRSLIYSVQATSTNPSCPEE